MAIRRAQYLVRLRNPKTMNDARWFHLREISVEDRGAIERIGRLRVRAWRTEVPANPEWVSWLDPFDNVARHWGVFDE